MNQRWLDELGQMVSEELIAMFMGTMIGEGCTRKVYSLPLLPGKVMKIEKFGETFHNTKEWDMWCAVRDTRWARWFCPIEAISYSGNMIIQPFCGRISTPPPRVPSFLQDLKLENWGLLNGKAVCVDYANNAAVVHALRAATLKKEEFVK